MDENGPKVVPAGEFKQSCLAMLDEVEAQHATIIVTKRGRPVAKLVPIHSDAEREFAVLQRLRGQVTMQVDEAELLLPMTDEWGDNQ